MLFLLLFGLFVCCCFFVVNNHLLFSIYLKSPIAVFFYFLNDHLLVLTFPLFKKTARCRTNPLNRVQKCKIVKIVSLSRWSRTSFWKRIRPMTSHHLSGHSWHRGHSCRFCSWSDDKLFSEQVTRARSCFGHESGLVPVTWWGTARRHVVDKNVCSFPLSCVIQVWFSFLFIGVVVVTSCSQKTLPSVVVDNKSVNDIGPKQPNNKQIF